MPLFYRSFGDNIATFETAREEVARCCCFDFVAFVLSVFISFIFNFNCRHNYGLLGCTSEINWFPRHLLVIIHVLLILDIILSDQIRIPLGEEASSVKHDYDDGDYGN